MQDMLDLTIDSGYPFSFGKRGVCGRNRTIMRTCPKSIVDGFAGLSTQMGSSPTRERGKEGGSGLFLRSAIPELRGLGCYYSSLKLAFGWLGESFIPFLKLFLLVFLVLSTLL